MAVARLARPGEEGAVAGVLAAAFAEDPTFNWLFQAEDTRPMFVTTWMRGAAESAIASGTCTGARPTIARNSSESGVLLKSPHRNSGWYGLLSSLAQAQISVSWSART